MQGSDDELDHQHFHDSLRCQNQFQEINGQIQNNGNQRNFGENNLRS